MTNKKITYLSTSDKVCPVCGSRHIQGISRITGYLTMDDRFGDGKTKERIVRVAHTTKKHDKNYI